MTDHPHGSVVSEEGGVAVRLIAGPDEASDALELLDHVEDVTRVPPVDESERERLGALAEADESAPHWHALLARRGRRAVGYAGVTVPGDGGGARSDLVVLREERPDDPTIGVLLTALERIGRTHGAERLQVWLRDATAPETAVLTGRGYAIDRRLAVLGRPLSDLPPVESPPAVTTRSFREADADAVVEVLARAYAGTANAGWDRAEFDARRELDWFDPADLLLAEERDRILGLHWTKDRGDETGEVYNLAIHPDAQGRGLGGALLRAGLTHLAGRGCRDVILWVDRANDAGLALYSRHGFLVRWEDAAFSRHLDNPPSDRPADGPRSPLF